MKPFGQSSEAFMQWSPPIPASVTYTLIGSLLAGPTTVLFSACVRGILVNLFKNSVNSIHSIPCLMLVAGVVTTCDMWSIWMNILKNPFRPFQVTVHMPRERGGVPMHNQPRIILMHNNPSSVISIRIILSWLCMDRRTLTDANCI